MKGRAYIEHLRQIARCGERVEPELLSDAVEIADEAAVELIRSECLPVTEAAPDHYETWWDTKRAINGLGGYNEVDECDPIVDALSYLDRRGLIERKEGEPHLLRFVEGV